MEYIKNIMHRKKSRRVRGANSLLEQLKSSGVSGIMPAKILVLYLHFLDKVNVFVILS